MKYQDLVGKNVFGKVVAVTLLSVFLVSCQTTGTTGDKSQYGIFFSPLDHVEDLIREGEIQSASEVYNDQQNYFLETGSNRGPAIEKLIEAVEPLVADKLQRTRDQLESVTWPSGQEAWPKIKEVLKDNKATLETVDQHKVLFHLGRYPNHYRQVRSQAAAVSRQIADAASTHFANFDIGKSESFFDAYPVLLVNDEGLGVSAGLAFKRDFLEKNAEAFRQQVAAARVDELRSIHGNYHEFLPEELALLLGNSYLNRFLAVENSTTGVALPAITRAVRTAKSEGFVFDKLSSVRVALVDVTSRTLQDEDQIEFPTSIDVDLPFEVNKSTVEDAFDSEIASAADIVIFVDIASARAERDILKQSRIPSLFQSGTKMVANPEYAKLQTELNTASMEWQRAAMSTASANNQFCQGWGCLAKVAVVAIAAAAESVAQKKVNDLTGQLNTTPLNVEEPEYSSYSFVKADIKSRKLATVHYHIIDRQSRTYFKDTFDVLEEQEFVVPYNVRKNDKDYDGAIHGSNRESEVVAFEEGAVRVGLSDLLDQYSGAQDKLRPMPKLEAIRADILADKNTALAEFRAQQYSAKPVNDDRFSRVVVVYHPGGSLGAGFYVRDDLVLTNFHVIENTKFVELQTFDGQETFGKVIANDARLDLALIRVQARGVPVKFFADNVLPLGATVEAIGHPAGHKFSVTRGVVSALRKQESLNVPGGKKVLFIQSDAVMNGGNSGGPMFMGSTVVGVNTWKRSDLEGIGFAIHYSEVLRFLEKNGISVAQAGEQS